MVTKSESDKLREMAADRQIKRYVAQFVFLGDAGEKPVGLVPPANCETEPEGWLPSAQYPGLVVIWRLLPGKRAA